MNEAPNKRQKKQTINRSKQIKEWSNGQTKHMHTCNVHYVYCKRKLHGIQYIGF